MPKPKNPDQDPLPLPEFEEVHKARQEEEKQERLEKLNKRANFVPAFFPKIYGYNESEFNEITQELSPDALRQSDPSVLKERIYKKSDQSLRSHRFVGEYVLLSSLEYNKVINVPEAYARGSQSRTKSSFRASFRDQEDRDQGAIRAGAYSLENHIKVMSNFVDMYAREIATLRRVEKLVKYHWHANAKSGMEVIDMANMTRDNLHQILQNIADVSGWSEFDLQDAKLGLDKRLMHGRGQEALDLKKANWTDLVKTLGNYTIAKKALVRDRVDRSNDEVYRRLGRTFGEE